MGSLSTWVGKLEIDKLDSARNGAASRDPPIEEGDVCRLPAAQQDFRAWHDLNAVLPKGICSSSKGDCCHNLAAVD